MKQQLKILCRESTPTSRVKTAQTMLYSSSVTEETAAKYQSSLQYIDQVEQLRDIQYTISFFPEPPKKQIIQDNIIRNGCIHSIRQMEFYYFQIISKGQKSPINCQVYCEGDFQLLVSFTNPTPTKFNCERVIRSRMWTLKHSGEDVVYVAFICRKDQDVKFGLCFGQQDQKKQIRPAYTNYFEYNDQHRPHTQQKPKSFVVKTTNKFELEMSRAQKYLNVLRTMSDSRMATKILQKQRDCELKSRELLHQTKLVHRLKQQQIDRKESMEFNWVQLIFQVHFYTVLNNVFQHKLLIHKRNRMAAIHIKIKLKHLRDKISKCRGDTIEERTIFETRGCLSMLCKTILPNILSKQLALALPILKQRAEIYRLKEQVFTTSRKIQLLRKSFTDFMLRVRKFKQEMLIQWDQYIQKQYQAQMKLKAQNRDKHQMAWAKQLQDKGFGEMMKQMYLKNLIRDRVRGHYEDQTVMKSLQAELQICKSNLQFIRDHLEATMLRQRIKNISCDLRAMQIKNQFFMHSNVESYMVGQMNMFLIINEEQVVPGQQPAKKKSIHPRMSVRRVARQSTLKS